MGTDAVNKLGARALISLLWFYFYVVLLFMWSEKLTESGHSCYLIAREVLQWRDQITFTAANVVLVDLI